MSGYAVDLGLLDDLVRRMVAFGHGLEAVHDDVETRMNRVRAVWTGLAAEEHVAAHARWQAGLRDMQESLRTLQAVAAGAHANYGAAIRANTGMWAS